VVVKHRAVLTEARELFTRILMKFDLMEKIPFVFGRERLTRTQLHMIESIGKGRGASVTALAEYFMVTKGAVSQVVTKLCARGFVSKGSGGGREKPLRLTKKGWKAFEMHEGYDEYLPELSAFTKKYTKEELGAFLRVLKGLDEMSGAIFADLVERSREEGGAGRTVAEVEARKRGRA
jgi:DNA-binding MarR family transcriptional regulator